MVLRLASLWMTRARAIVELAGPSLLLFLVMTGMGGAALAQQNGDDAQPLSSSAFGATRASSSGSLDLWTLYQLAMTADPRLAIAAGRAETAEGQRRAARGQLLPQLSASASLNRVDRRVDPFRQLYNGERYALNASQVLFNAGAWRNYRQYAALAAQSEAEFEGVRSDATLDLIERYFTTLAAEDELALLQAERRATQRNLERVESLFERQLATVTDVLQISARVDALAAAEVSAANEVAVARESLAEIVGQPVAGRLMRIAPDAEFALPADDEQRWVEMALNSNAGLRAHQKAIAASEAAVAAAKGMHLPTINLFATAQQTDLGYDNTLAPESDTFVIGVGIEIPLFTGGTTSGSVRASYGDLAVAQGRHEAYRRQLMRETRSAFLNVQAGVVRVRAGRQALTSAEKAREATEKSFGYGVKNAIDVLDAVRDEYQARRDLLQAQYDFIVNLMALNGWAGSLGEEQVRGVNRWLEGDSATPPGSGGEQS